MFYWHFWTGEQVLFSSHLYAMQAQGPFNVVLWVSSFLDFVKQDYVENVFACLQGGGDVWQS